MYEDISVRYPLLLVFMDWIQIICQVGTNENGWNVSFSLLRCTYIIIYNLLGRWRVSGTGLRRGWRCRKLEIIIQDSNLSKYKKYVRIIVVLIAFHTLSRATSRIYHKCGTSQTAVYFRVFINVSIRKWFRTNKQIL